MPVFIANVDELKSNLRLTGASDLPGSDFPTILEQAMRKVRLNFLRSLGERRVERIKADTGIYREMAELAEIAWVRLELTYLLPVLFQDASAHSREQYNDEGAFRRSFLDDLQILRGKLKMEINLTLSNLRKLAPDQKGPGRFQTFGPDRPMSPGETVL